MGTTLATQEEKKLAEPKRKLKVIVPPDVTPSKYLEKSLRFKQYNIESFEKLRDFTRECFNVDFEILYIGRDVINPDDLKQHDYVAFLSIQKTTLSDIIDKFTNLGIPVVFIRHVHDMECELINLTNKENECFKNRPTCIGEGSSNCETHCERKFSEDFTFDDETTTIPKVKEIFGQNTEYLPIFPMNFLIDFLIWYGKYGIILKKNRDEYIRTDTILSDWLKKTVGNVLALKSKLRQG